MRTLLKAFILLPFFLLGSCKYFEKQVPDEEELLKERLEKINWKEVSSYPSLAECDSITDKEQKKTCFFETMARLVQERLDVDTLALLYPEMDTIEVKVTVYPDATIKFESQVPKDSVRYDVAKIDSLLQSRLTNFPSIEPAQKEGVPVTSQFILPVIINVE